MNGSAASAAVGSEVNVSTPFPRIFPAMLRALRIHHKLTQRQLAARLGVPQSSVAHHETFGRGTEDVLTRYAEVLGYPDLLAMLAHGIELLRAPPEVSTDAIIPTDADLLREILTRTGWRKYEVARRLSISPGYVTLILSGKRGLSADVRDRLERLVAVARGENVSS